MRVISSKPLVLITPPKEAGRMSALDLQTVAALRFITTERECIYRYMLDKAFAKAGICPPVIASEVGSITAIGRLVTAGVGSALVPRLAVEDILNRGDVAALPWPATGSAASLVLMWRRRRVLSPLLKRFLVADELAAPVRSTGGPLDMQDSLCRRSTAHGKGDRLGNVGGTSNPADRQTLLARAFALRDSQAVAGRRSCFPRRAAPLPGRATAAVHRNPEYRPLCKRCGSTGRPT